VHQQNQRHLPAALELKSVRGDRRDEQSRGDRRGDEGYHVDIALELADRGEPRRKGEPE
jgi:hypothetical protein